MPLPSDVQLHLVDSFDDAADMMRWLGERRELDEIAVDTETTGLDTERDRARLIQFGDLHHGWAVPRDEWLGLARDVVRRWKGRFVGHNIISYDDPILSRDCGIELPRERTDCTRLMSHVLEPAHSTALKTQATRHVDPVAAGAQAKLDEALGAHGGWTWATVPITFEPYWTYGALDAVLNAHLSAHHRPLVEADAPRAYELERAVSWVLARSKRYGARIDTSFTRQKLDAFESYVEEAARWVKTHFGVSAGSNQKVIDALQRDGVEFTKQTAQGALALDRDVLEGIDHPLAATVLQRRRLQKLASTYLAHFLRTDDRGLIHPSINVVGARTSRMSCSDPNLQNLPRRSNSNPAADVVRDCVVSRWALDVLDWTDLRTDKYDPLVHGALLMCDFDQIEMRLLAHMAQEQAMIDAFVGEGDFFVNLARQIFNDPALVKSDPRRQLTKNAGYAKIYGAGVAKFALTAGVSEADARAFLQRFDQLYPGVTRFQKRVDQLAWQRFSAEGAGYVRSPLTGRRHVADRGKVYALVNYLIQGTAAEILKMKILEADAAGLGDWFVVPVHDELVLDVPGEHVRDAAHALRRTMCDDTLFGVPITASVSFGASWGTKADWAVAA